jgi:hypothetical protein
MNFDGKLIFSNHLFYTLWYAGLLGRRADVVICQQSVVNPLGLVCPLFCIIMNVHQSISVRILPFYGEWL